MPDPKKPSAEAVKASQELAIWLVERVGPFKPGLPVNATLVVADTIDLHFAPRIAALEAEIVRLRGLMDVAERLIVSATTCERSEQWLAVADQFMLGYGSARNALAQKEGE